MNNRFKSSVASAFELPLDVVMRLPLITMTGGMLLEVENHRGILEYTQRKIRIDTAEGPLTVAGDNLLVASIHPERIVIRGGISGVSLRTEGG